MPHGWNRDPAWGSYEPDPRFGPPPPFHAYGGPPPWAAPPRFWQDADY